MLSLCHRGIHSPILSPPKDWECRICNWKIVASDGFRLYLPRYMLAFQDASQRRSFAEVSAEIPRYAEVLVRARRMGSCRLGVVCIDAAGLFLVVISLNRL